MRIKFFTLFLGFAVVFCLFFASGAYAAQEPTVNLSGVYAGGGALIKLSGAEAAPGESVTLSLSVADNPGLCGMRLFVGYDSNILTLESAEFTSLFGGGGVEVNTAINPFVLLWNLGTSNFTENGELAVLRFKVKEGAAAGNTALTLSCEDGDAFNVNFVDVNLSLENGTVTVKGGSAEQNGASTSENSTSEPASDASDSGTMRIVFYVVVIALIVVAVILILINKKKSIRNP